MPGVSIRHDAVAEDYGGIADIDARDPQTVLRVSLFGDEARELLPQGLRVSSVGFFRRRVRRESSRASTARPRSG